MLYPIIVFAIGLALLVVAFGVGWAGWFAGETAVPVGYFWLFLAAFVICTVSIIRWGVTSKSYGDRKRWVAFILGTVLSMGLGAWWIVSVSVFIIPSGLILFIVSILWLIRTFGSSDDDVVRSNR